MKQILFYVGMFILGVLIGRVAVVFVKDDIKNKENKKVAVIEEWNTLYPDAIGKTYYTFCDENGFLREVHRYSYEISSEYLVRSDNEVPIRCNPTSINVIERTGTNSKTF